ncbi:hypothetical protein BT63DRAFT_482671 [Microthyrium microscopicum]|uniref:NADAR domain-containing protein n=1 Tax=Microthyrium microscopicum TaxID=703497 RepID=A0A6A6U0B7_9PEZI|nr:hypothetical protein BT63DRAFT_482671 [Microthyrium microscopicum]
MAKPRGGRGGGRHNDRSDAPRSIRDRIEENSRVSKARPRERGRGRGGAGANVDRCTPPPRDLGHSPASYKSEKPEDAFKSNIKLLEKDTRDKKDTAQIRFWPPADPIGGFLSPQWKSAFKEDGWTYSCVDMYMAAKFAEYMGEHDQMGEILQLLHDIHGLKKMKTIVDDIKKDRRLDEWEQASLDIMLQANRLKFKYSERSGLLKEALTATSRRPLAFCDRDDSFWGTGYGPADEDQSGSGQNHLGIVLEKLREELSPEVPEDDGSPNFDALDGSNLDEASISDHNSPVLVVPATQTTTTITSNVNGAQAISPHSQPASHPYSQPRSYASRQSTPSHTQSPFGQPAHPESTGTASPAIAEPVKTGVDSSYPEDEIDYDDD